MPSKVKLSDALALKVAAAEPDEDEAAVLAAFAKHEAELASALAWHVAERDRKLAELAAFRALQAQVAADTGVDVAAVAEVDLEAREFKTKVELAAEVEAKAEAARASKADEAKA